MDRILLAIILILIFSILLLNTTRYENYSIYQSSPAPVSYPHSGLPSTNLQLVEQPMLPSMPMAHQGSS